MLTATTNNQNWSNCTVLCVKKGRIIRKDMTSWFSSTTTHYRIRQQWSKTTWRLNWEVLPHPTYSPDLAPSDYHLFSMGHALAEWHFDSYIRKWIDEWFASKDEEFFWRGIHKLPERWEKCIISGQVLWINLFLLPRKKNVFFWLKNGFKLIHLV